MLRSLDRDGVKIDYELVYTARKSGVRISVQNGVVRVNAPAGIPPNDVDASVLKNAEWIRGALARFAKVCGEQLKPFTNGRIFDIEGAPYVLRIVKADRKNVQVTAGELVVQTPDISSETVRAAVREYLIHRAGDLLQERTKHYGSIIGRSPAHITIREQKTRWGSCSSKGNLNFNWRLIMAPREALDYVVIHELCHLYEMNHSAAFWKRVSELCPDYLKWRDYLKKNPIAGI